MGQEANCQVSHEGGRGGQKKNVKENHVGQEADRHLRRVKTGGPTWAQASQEAWPRSECPMPRSRIVPSYALALEYYVFDLTIEIAMYQCQYSVSSMA